MDDLLRIESIDARAAADWHRERAADRPVQTPHDAENWPTTAVGPAPRLRLGLAVLAGGALLVFTGRVCPMAPLAFSSLVATLARLGPKGDP